MPAIRYYSVTQTREVRVAASTPMTAAMIANDAFKTGQGVSVAGEGGTTSEVRTIDIHVSEEL